MAVAVIVSTLTRGRPRVEPAEVGLDRLAAEVSTLTRGRPRVERVSRTGSMRCPMRFQPSPGVAPRVEHRGLGRSSAPGCFNPHPGSPPGGTASLPRISRRSRAFQPSPGVAPGWNNSANGARLSNERFNPHPGSPPGGTVGRHCSRTGPRGFNPHPGSPPGGTMCRPRPVARPGSSFNPHPGSPPGGTGRGARRHRVDARVSTLTRGRPRVERGRCVPPSGSGSFNPHPGSPPGGTFGYMLHPLAEDTFQPSPGVAPGWNGGGPCAG